MFRGRNSRYATPWFLAQFRPWPLSSPSITRKDISRLQFEPRDQFEQRQKKLEQIQKLGFDPFPREFRWTHSSAELVHAYSQSSASDLEANRRDVRVAGRMVSIRLMGKAGFAHLQGSGGRIQIYVKKDVVAEKGFELFHLLDLGDSIGVHGHLFRTRTNELSIFVKELVLLSKALLPLPEKWHGLSDVELRYRQRYLDLIVNEVSRKVFTTRARVIQELRKFFDSRGYIEVETPMMHPIPGGAAARPFVTHHNTLDMDLYLRIAPELYLKRLTVGGFDRVYEINRNFRNEGISTQHNPEFTMLEFYQAYTDYQGLMDFTCDFLKQTALDATGSTVVEWQGHTLDFANIRRVSMQEAVGTQVPLHGHALVEAFERNVERTLIEPTIIYDYPVEVSPLSKVKASDPAFVERFENYAAGMEIGNAYTELNDPQEQRCRFEAQLRLKAAGDEEAHQMDEDYIRALCYGMPPTGGEGIGIDRLTMILTNSKSIRDVILFPLLRPEGEIGLAEKLRRIAP